MQELIADKVEDVNFFFSQVAEQLLATAEIANRRGYYTTLELGDPKIYYENGQESLKVFGKFGIKNNNTGANFSVFIHIKENTKFEVHESLGSSGITILHAPEIELHFPSSITLDHGDLSLEMNATFFIAKPTDRDSWICVHKRELTHLKFDQVFQHVAELCGQSSDPKLKSGFRGFKAVPLVEDVVAERPASPMQTRGLPVPPI